MRPFRPYSSFELERFAEDLQATLTDWEEQWMPTHLHGTTQARVSRECEASASPWYRAQGEQVFYLASTSNSSRTWLTALLAERATMRAELDDNAVPDLALQLLGGVLADLVARLLGVPLQGTALLLADPAASAELKNVNAGQLFIEMSLDLASASMLRLALPLRSARRWNARLRGALDKHQLEPLMRRSTAIETSGVALEVQLDADAVPLAELQDLQVGDVLLLKHSIRKPLRVNVCDGQFVGFCYLGRIGESRGIRLANAQENKRHV